MKKMFPCFNIQIIIPQPDTLYLEGSVFTPSSNSAAASGRRNRLQQSIQFCARNIAVPDCQCLVIGNDANGPCPHFVRSPDAPSTIWPLTFIGQHRFQPPVRSGKCSQEILLHGRIAVIIVPHDASRHDSRTTSRLQQCFSYLLTTQTLIEFLRRTAKTSFGCSQIIRQRIGIHQQFSRRKSTSLSGRVIRSNCPSIYNL